MARESDYNTSTLLYTRRALRYFTRNNFRIWKAQFVRIFYNFQKDCYLFFSSLNHAS